MTAYKEYLRKKGEKLEEDFDYLPCDMLQGVRTRVTESGVSVINYYSSITIERKYDRRGNLQ